MNVCLRFGAGLGVLGGVSMTNFHIPLEKPEEIIPRLGKQQLHWKKGRSAYELSTAWVQAGGVPASVRAVIEQAPEWRGAVFLEGVFERETQLPGRGRPSQTDLLAILKLNDENAILGVEGKVDESFGPLVNDWLASAKDQNRLDRLTGLCHTLGVDQSKCGELYYQLFHRTCASIYEAKRFGYSRAMMLVHSFAEPADKSTKPAWFDEFCEFSIAVGMPLLRSGSVSAPKSCDGVTVRLAWVSDVPSEAAKPLDPA